MNIICNVKKLSPEVKLPKYATDGSGCFDIFLLPLATAAVIETIVLHTGLCFEIPEDHVMLIYSRSGHAFKADMRLANCVAVIDSDYRGEVILKLTRDSLEATGYGPYELKNGQAIAQGMIIPVSKVEFTEVEELEETVRGTGGFGSTDKVIPETDKDYPLGESK